jgi:hypothetical protein
VSRTAIGRGLPNAWRSAASGFCIGRRTSSISSCTAASSSRAQQADGRLRLVERDVDPTAVDNDIWTRTLARIERQVTRHQFYTWFRHTVLVSDHGDVIEVGKPGEGSDLIADWLQRHSAAVIQEAIAAERPGTRVDIVVVTDQRRRQA